jgi:hypothetical protein
MIKIEKDNLIGMSHIKKVRVIQKAEDLQENEIGFIPEVGCYLRTGEDPVIKYSDSMEMIYHDDKRVKVLEEKNENLLKENNHLKEMILELQGIMW